MAAWTRSFRVLRYDQRGHGESDAPAGAYSMDRPLHSEMLAGTIAGAKSLMFRAAHLSNVEQPDAFAQAVLDFLNAA